MGYRVIDLNEHNCWVNFKALEQDAVILRVGYRGFGGKGRMMNDTRFMYFIEECKRNNIPVGLYFESQATSVKEAKEEARFVLKYIVGKYWINLPIYISINYPKYSKGYMGRLYNAQISREKQTRIVKAFCDTIIDKGYQAGVFAKYDFFKKKMNVSELADYSLWVSHYSVNGVPPLAGVNFDMWQFTDDAEVKGVIGMVNADCLFNESIIK